MSLFEQSFVVGTITRILFQNNDNYYTVLKAEVIDSNEDFDDDATITGYLPQIAEGDTYKFTGKIVTHAKYGKQLQAERFEKDMPQTKDGIIHYLSSDLFKGVGKKTARTIVEILGEDALNIILSDKSALDAVPKLSDEKKTLIYETIHDNQAIEKIMIKLNDWGFGPQLAMKIYQFYKEDTLEIIKQSPYQLVMDIDGIGFNKADELAVHLGIDGSHTERLKAALTYSMDVASIQNGHTYIPKQSLLEISYDLLTKNQRQIDADKLVAALSELTEEKRLIDFEENIYIPSLFYSESKSAQLLYKLSNNKSDMKVFEQSEVLMAIGELEELFEVSYHEKQREALTTAMREKVMILSGGPGTGKTTVIRGIVTLYAELHGLSLDYDDYEGTDFPIVVAAPTGRASKRLSESTGLEATTIHRLIGWTKENKPDDILENDIAARLIIIDEMSMVDTWLMFQLLKAVDTDAQIIFVGDQDQLPSVGPGQVFKDMIDAGVIPQVELSEVYRQQEGSSIIELAHQIKQRMPFDITKRYPDRSFVPCRTEQVSEVIEQIVIKAVDKGYDKRDIQVLAPIYKGNAGIRALNIVLQKILNPKSDDKREMTFGDVVYRNGDKVLQLVNRPEDSVFNGDIGEVIGIFMAKENALNKDVVIVDYDGNEVTYTKQDLMELTHAYCCSIHKSQGSEFPIVIMPVVNQYFRMLQRNILYTGLTRAKQSLILLGDINAFNSGIERNTNVRFTSFLTFLHEYFEVTQTNDMTDKIEETRDESNVQEGDIHESERQTISKISDVPESGSTLPFGIGEMTEENMHEVHPLINMTGISPYDYL